MNAKKLLKIVLIFGCLFSLISISRCNKLTTLGHDKQIKENINNSLKVYPTKDLENFYDIDGYKSSDFDKNDKGVWVFDTSINKKSKNTLHSEGAILFINRNKSESTGHYYIRNFKDQGQDTVKKYPIKLKGNRIYPINDKINESVKNKIKRFRFLIQYTDINDSIKDKKGKLYYNYNTHTFKGRYTLNGKDQLLKEIIKKYNLTSKQADLLIKGPQKPNTKGISDKGIQISINKHKYYLSDYIIYKPDKENKDE